MNVLDRQPSFQDLPPSAEGLLQTALQFVESRGPTNPLSGFVAAVDGLLLQIEKPEPKHHPREFFTRKGFLQFQCKPWSMAVIILQPVRQFCAGSTYYSVALELYIIGRYLEDGMLKLGYWIAGNDAYSVPANLIVPISRSVVNVVQDAFTFYQSSHRIHVEQAFGILKNNWGMLWRPFRFNLCKATLIIWGAMRLQNSRIDYDGGIS